jgi:hypothetical protein
MMERRSYAPRQGTEHLFPKEQAKAHEQRCELAKARCNRGRTVRLNKRLRKLRNRAAGLALSPQSVPFDEHRFRSKEFRRQAKDRRPVERVPLHLSLQRAQTRLKLVQRSREVKERLRLIRGGKVGFDTAEEKAAAVKENEGLLATAVSALRGLFGKGRRARNKG